VRELGIERFRETLFATEAAELTAEGWAKHEKHITQAAPLTQEEEGQADLREAEAQESGGTTARKGHVGSKLDAIKTEDGLEEKLGELMKEGNAGLLVQLVSIQAALRGDTLEDITSTNMLPSTSTCPTRPSASPRPRPPSLLPNWPAPYPKPTLDSASTPTPAAHHKSCTSTHARMLPS
jgi:twinfilin-like protein